MIKIEKKFYEWLKGVKKKLIWTNPALEEKKSLDKLKICGCKPDCGCKKKK